MLLIVLLAPILADMVPMAETTKTEVQTISPKIIQKDVLKNDQLDGQGTEQRKIASLTCPSGIVQLDIYTKDVLLLVMVVWSIVSGIINLYKCQNSPVQQAPNQTPQFQAPQFQAVPPARPEPPVTLTSGNDPNFPAPPSNRDSYTLPNVTTNIAETRLDVQHSSHPYNLRTRKSKNS